MRVVIDVPDRVYKAIKNSTKPLLYVEHLIQEGTALPKGHGRLGDLDKLEKKMENYIIFNVHDCVELVNCADTIIEADKEEE
jgi:hypothetical protein